MLQALLDQSIAFVAMAVLLGCSAFFSGSETALFSLTREELDRLAIRPVRASRFILALLRDPPALLSAILFGNMVVNVTFYSISTLVTVRLAEYPAAAAGFGIASLLTVIILGEVSPKGIAVGHPVGFAKVVAAPLYVFVSIARPVSGVLKWLARKASGLFLRRLPRLPYVTREELKLLTGIAEHRGVLDRRTRGMLEQVVEIAQIRLNEVMTPRVDVPMFDLGRDRQAFCAFAREVNEERVAVYEGSKDTVVGILVSRDVFLNPESPLRELLKPVCFVPETLTVEKLLAQFRRTRAPVAIVVDEYGGTAGIVTLKHLLEEVVGEMRHELEPAETPVEQLDEDTYLLDGSVNTHEWRQLLGVGFDPPGVETMAGFVISLMGRIPREGDWVEWNGLRFTIEKMTGRRVHRVRVQRFSEGEG